MTAFERVVQLVGDGGGQAAHGHQTFCLGERLFCALARGDIFRDDDDALRLTFLVTEQSYRIAGP